MEKTNQALLVMDMQMGIIASLSNLPALLTNIKRAIDTARDQKIPVIYITVAFRPGSPEISSHNSFFSSSKTRFDSIGFSDIHPDLEPNKGEYIVHKKRFSAFTGSDLEVLLRGLQVNHLVLTGVSTAGVVLSTTREAADKDFEITILSDCCTDPDDEVHSVLMKKVFPRQSKVITIDQWCIAQIN